MSSKVSSVVVVVISKGCEKSNLSFEASHNKVASVELLTASCIVIPAPLAEPDVSPEPKLRVIFLSSTSSVAVFKVVVVPCTVKSPATVRSLNVTSSDVATA